MKNDDFWSNELGSLPSWDDEHSETLLRINALYRELGSLAKEIVAKTDLSAIGIMDFEAILGKADLILFTVKSAMNLKGTYEDDLSRELMAIENIRITVGGLKRNYEEGIEVNPPWSLAGLALNAFADFMSLHENVGKETD